MGAGNQSVCNCKYIYIYINDADYTAIDVDLPEPPLRLCGPARLFSPSAGPYCTTAFLRLKSMQRPLEDDDNDA